MYSISATGKIFEASDKIFLGIGSRQVIVLNDRKDLYLAILKEMAERRGVRVPEPSFSKIPELKGAFEDLLRSGVISDVDTTNFNSQDVTYKTKLYIESLPLDSKRVEETAQSTTVLILGCGGIGNQVAYSLASSPVSNIVLVDGDIVEESNLNRQFLFSRKDLGFSKASVLKERLNELRPELNITCISEYVSRESIEQILEQIGGSAVAIISADSRGILKSICPSLMKAGVPFLNVGYLNDISIIGPFWTSKNDACPFCGNRLGIEAGTAHDSLSAFFDAYEAPSCMVNNSFAGAMAVSDLFNFWSGNLNRVVSLNKRIGLVNPTFNRVEISLNRDPMCAVCGFLER